MTALLVFAFFAAGALAGVAHFAAIARDVDLLVHGGSALAALGLRLGRLALTVVVLLLAAIVGHWPALLAATAGFMLARQVGIGRRRETS